VPPVPTLLSPPHVTRRLLSDAPFWRSGDEASVGECGEAGISSLSTNVIPARERERAGRDPGKSQREGSCSNDRGKGRNSLHSTGVIPGFMPGTHRAGRGGARCKRSSFQCQPAPAEQWIPGTRPGMTPERLRATPTEARFVGRGRH
jgi:hypothetical protein